MPTSIEPFLPLKPAHFHILLTLVDQPVHGYGIRREVEERTDGRIVLAAGTLYETLQRLLDADLIYEAEPTPESLEEASSRWRFYAATPLGRQVATAELQRLESDVRAARARLAREG